MHGIKGKTRAISSIHYLLNLSRLCSCDKVPFHSNTCIVSFAFFFFFHCLSIFFIYLIRIYIFV